MAWIESHTTLDKHPKTLLLKRRLRWSQNETIGFLHRFWWTVLDYAPDGVVSALPPVVIAESLGMDPAVVEKVVAEMEAVGLLTRHGGKLMVHDWIDYAGEFLRTNKFRRKPDRWQATIKLYEDARTTASPEAGDKSRDMSGDLSRLPTGPNRPDRTDRAAGDGGGDGTGSPEDLDARIKRYIQGHRMLGNWDQVTHGKLRKLVECEGWDRASELIEQGVAAGKPFPVGWALGAAQRLSQTRAAATEAKPLSAAPAGVRKEDWD